MLINKSDPRIIVMNNDTTSILALFVKVVL